MARPQKTGLEYFPFDVDFFDDDKISAIFVEFGIKGEIAAVKLLCAVYRNGYFIEWKDSVRIKLLKSLPGISSDLLEQIVRSLVKWGFFDKTLFDTAAILTSKGIQSRYFSATKRRVKDLASLPYLLADVPDNDKFLHTETEFLHTETPLLHTESTQSKVKKETSLRSVSSSSSSSPSSHACEGKDEFMITARDAVNELKADEGWLLQMQRRHGIATGTIANWLDSFVVECDCRGTQEHADMADVKKHFNDWLKIQLLVRQRGGKKKRPSAGPGTDITARWLRCQAELCTLVGKDTASLTFGQLTFGSYDPSANTLLLVVPSMETYERIEETHVRLFEQVLSKHFGNCTVKYNIHPKEER